MVFDPNSAQYNADLNGDDDDDDEMDEEEEEEEDNSVDNLMELDIISFDEDDMDFLESEDESGSTPAAKQGRFEIDPCCFNFDWNNNQSNTNSGNNKPSTSYNLCGLEAWGMSSNHQNKSIPNASLQTGRGELQQKIIGLNVQAPYPGNGYSGSNLNVTSFFSPR